MHTGRRSFESSLAVRVDSVHVSASLYQGHDDGMQRHEVADRFLVADDYVQRRIPFQIHGVHIKTALDQQLACRSAREPALVTGKRKVIPIKLSAARFIPMLW